MTILLADITSIIAFVSIHTRAVDLIPFIFHSTATVLPRVCVESTQLEDPRQEWKSIQESMLHEYLTSAHELLVGKKKMYDVKHQRLLLAQDKYKQLNALAASRSSCKFSAAFFFIFNLKSILIQNVIVCSSSSSISTRQDPEVLKADLAIVKDRVQQLKRELLQITSDITYTQRGVNTLYS